MANIRRTPSPESHIEFLEFHQPALESGTYEVTWEQTLQSSKFSEQRFTKSLTFVVTGERFGPLPPKEVVAVFPPADSVGEHAHVLPHITLHRSTLPWERLPGPADENHSWLALLLLRDSDFANAEKPRESVMTLRQLLATPGSTAKFPVLSLEPGQAPEEEVRIIDLQRKVLEAVLPSGDELALLAHVRQRKSSNGAEEGDCEATVLCHRLPEPGGHSTVHLVSLEKRYDVGGAFDFQGAGPNDWIRLVSLKSWSFFSVDPDQSFSALLRRLDRTPSLLRLPELVPASSPAAEYLLEGHAAVPHRMRRGSQSVSFYRGPLIPGSTPDALSLPAHSSDELLRYDPATGMLDATYAAAWELGRLTTLANQRVALELFNWKRRASQQLYSLGQRSWRRLPVRRASAELTSMPEAVDKWFQALALLEGVPFSYLVPDERMLPVEGLRFFRVDPLWVDCLLDGALAIGRVTEADWQRDFALRERRSFSMSKDGMSGFLMRSTVVSGYPGLLVEAYAERVEDPGSIPVGGDVLPQLRVDTLSDDILIGLFDGQCQTVDFFQKPEGLSFGLDVPTTHPPTWTKNLRLRTGEATDLRIESVPFHDPAKSAVNTSRLAELMREKLEWPAFTAAQFALEMIEGGPRIRFVAGS
ncbi:hypothetical protein BHS06_29155 [Myxococcus xanthus]|uniref:hypothetical protein n=1 Tax=Myxococcus xanthus TaxID=34 RepID=UPI00112D47E0|nr:hypothetical protein [Myxococcus xanthus]QDE92722.1 hypothetical protein BHS06_29155 [Myxococcus xanthus]